MTAAQQPQRSRRDTLFAVTLGTAPILAGMIIIPALGMSSAWFLLFWGLGAAAYLADRYFVQRHRPQALDCPHHMVTGSFTQRRRQAPRTTTRRTSRLT